jgi:hypothetical protein
VQFVTQPEAERRKEEIKRGSKKTKQRKNGSRKTMSASLEKFGN